MNAILQFNSAVMMFMDEQKKQKDKVDLKVKDNL